MWIKKTVSILLAGVITLGISCYSEYYAYALSEPVYDIRDDMISYTGHSSDDEVTFIVEVEGDPVLAGKEASAAGTDFINTADGKEKEDMVLSAQASVLGSINSEIAAETKVEAVYTMLFNGFAMRAAYGDMEAIKAINGVKNVYVLPDIRLETHLSESVGMTGSLSDTAKDYTGRGQLVAVIDTEFDTNHEFFASAPENPKFAAKDEVGAHIKDKGLITNDASRVYVNQKIPYAYDYFGNDNDLYATVGIHGTHVAGIVGGKGGITDSGVILNGVAPDTQLVLMKTGNNSGDPDIAKSLLALEDAVKLGVCAVNCSFGAKYISPAIDPVFEAYMQNARNAGVYVSVSAGNESRGYLDNPPLTDNIDYSASGVPGTFSSVMTVGAVNTTDPSDLSMYSYSSYGVTENLELKPEISAPGYGIYSSVPGDGYNHMTGTSMAAPHITGAVAVMNEYFDANMPYIKGVERLKLIENMLMSTADVVCQSNSVPYSPRVQGAGLVNVDSALKTSVVLTGNGEKSKISLGDDLGSTFEVSFTANNFGTSSVTYDKTSLSLVTDGYKTTSGKHCVSNSVALSTVSHTLPQSITLTAGETKEIAFEVRLDENWLYENSEIFKNGFYIDGFVSLENTSGQVPKVGIPFMGFYGDWTKASVFDSTIYDAGGSTLANSVSGATLLYTKVGNNSNILGYNGVEGYNTKYIALSPNGDGVNDAMGLQFKLMRTISQISSYVKNSKGNAVTSKSAYSVILNKYTQTYGLDLNDVSSLDDGDYTMVIEGKYNYEKDNATLHKLEIPFYIDTKSPEIVKAVPDGDKIKVTFRDNRHVSYVYTCYEDSTGTVHVDQKPIGSYPNGDSVTVEFDLADINAENAPYDDIEIYVHDDAENVYANTLSCLTGDIHPEITSFTYADGIMSAKLDITSYKPSQTCSLILAFYDNDGTLVYVNVKENVSLANGTSNHTFADFADLSRAHSCRLFIWNDINGITPTDTSKSFNITMNK